MRNGSATICRSFSVIRTAYSSSTKMNTSRIASSVSMKASGPVSTAPRARMNAARPTSTAAPTASSTAIET